MAAPHLRLTAVPAAFPLLAALAAAGCATAPPAPVVEPGGAPVEEASAPSHPQPEGGAAPAPRGPVLALLDEAGAAERAGDLEGAAASVERALRIAPRDAVLWHRLARIRLAQGRWRQAESLARRSLALAPRARALAARNWRLIARARRARGDAAGAREAERRAAALEGATG